MARTLHLPFALVLALVAAVSPAAKPRQSGPTAIPPLAEQLRREKTCQLQWRIAGAILQLDREHPVLTPTLADIVRGRCDGRTPADFAARRDASMALGVRADGVSLVAGLLKDRDLFTRQTAIISLDGLAERLTAGASGMPEPALIGPAVEAIPAIVSAFNDENEVVRCTSARVINRFLQPVAPSELRDEAARRTQGVVARCSRPAAARVPVAPPVVTRQEPQAPSPAEVQAVVDQLEDLDQQVVLRAVQTLAATGPSVVPLLVEQLDQRKGCQFQWSASGVIAMVDRQQGAFIGRILVGIAKGECTGSSQLDSAVRRQAALVLVTKEDGVPVVAELFKDPDLFVRRTAAFAFDELAERLQSGRPDRISSPTPGFVMATIAAIPALVDALKSEDEIVRCMSYEALVEFQSSNQPEVRSAARRVGDIRTPRGCSSR